MRFFSQQPLRQLYKNLYQMTFEELEGLIHSYGPAFIQLETQQAHEERNIAFYREQIASLRAQQETFNLPALADQITMLVTAMRGSEKELETLQDEVADLANEFGKVKDVLGQ